MDLLDALGAATEEFGKRLALVHADMWTSATPCPEWDVSYLAAHVIGGNRFAIEVLAGLSAADAIEQVMSTPQLGDDAMGAWRSTSQAQIAAFQLPDVLTEHIDHPLGEITGYQFLEFRVYDITLHAWDLARSIGADEELDSRLVDAVIGIVEHGPPGMGFGVKALTLAMLDASPQVRLLDLCGRHS
ncbi:MAG: TIGR03086 family metal-binding protein [Acidimicrobiales bacterium]